MMSYWISHAISSASPVNLRLMWLGHRFDTKRDAPYDHLGLKGWRENSLSTLLFLPQASPVISAEIS